MEGYDARNLLGLLIVGLGLVNAVLPVRAHHSEAAEFDSSKPVKVTGVIRKVEWQNPHVWFYVDVKDENGTITTWGFAGAPPGSLMRRARSSRSSRAASSGGSFTSVR